MTRFITVNNYAEALLSVLIIAVAVCYIAKLVRGKVKRDKLNHFYWPLIVSLFTLLMTVCSYNLSLKTTPLDCVMDGAIGNNPSVLAKDEFTKSGQVRISVNDNDLQSDGNQQGTLNLTLHPIVRLGEIKAAGLFIGSDQNNQVSPVNLTVGNDGSSLSLYGSKLPSVVRGSNLPSTDGIINCYLIVLGTNGRTYSEFAELKPSKTDKGYKYTGNSVCGSLDNLDLCNNEYMGLQLKGESPQLVQQQFRNAKADMNTVY